MSSKPVNVLFCFVLFCGSDWIGRTKQRKVFVTSTMKRPVPLQHYLYYDDEIYKAMICIIFVFYVLTTIYCFVHVF